MKDNTIDIEIAKLDPEKDKAAIERLEE